MRPYETIEELEGRIEALEKCLYDSRRLQFNIRTGLQNGLSKEDEELFLVFEKLLRDEIDEIRFHIKLEKMLLGEEH